ncbi:CaiB/BaiF CoA transferase family protein [Streptomyces sp. NPDC051217]|uniref:CaiB/BaiF CoA transferase family protein n=1 Tax=Streptomyces sp. NPDC051217 TaxID=3365644 RepID=UPI0037AAF7DD
MCEVNVNPVHGPGMLTGVSVIDLSETRGAYAARMLADLGAAVFRVEPPLRRAEDPGSRLPGMDFSARSVFNNLSKTIAELDDTSPAGRAELQTMLASADIVVTDTRPEELRRRSLDDLSARYPRLIHLSVSPWGLTGPDSDRPASDLSMLAAGGLLSLAGDPDDPPVRPYAEQSSVAACLHGVVGALIALFARDCKGADGAGQLVDVSAQEAVAHSLENAVQYLDLEGLVRTRTGSRSSEAGTGLFRCLDGHVYLVTGLGGLPLAWDGLIGWLRESGAAGIADKLSGQQWLDQQWRRSAEAVQGFHTLFERYAAGRTKVQLCEEGQRHGVSISPVSTPEDLLANEQLLARGFFRQIPVNGETVTVPGAPYRFEGVEVGPVSPRRVHRTGRAQAPVSATPPAHPDSPAA